MKVSELRVEPKFRDLIPKLSEEEYTQLERNILEDGEIREHIIAWDGVIIDGHNRHKIWMAHQSLDLPCTVDNWHFNNEYEAMSWACNNQLGRRNLTDAQKTYLLGKRYENEKLAHGGDHGIERQKDGTFSPKVQNDLLGDCINKKQASGTAERLASEYGIGSATVKRAEKFSKGIDIIEKQEPELKDAILSGTVKIPKATIKRLPETEPEEQKAVVEAIKNVQKAETPKEKSDAIKKTKAMLKGEESTAEEPQTKVCSKCGRELPISNFYICKGYRRSECAQCFNSNSKSNLSITGENLGVSQEYKKLTYSDIVGNLNGEQEITYTDADFVEELTAIFDSFEKSVERCLLIHEELSVSNESKKEITSRMNEAVMKIEKWKEKYNE